MKLGSSPSSSISLGNPVSQRRPGYPGNRGQSHCLYHGELEYVPETWTFAAAPDADGQDGSAIFQIRQVDGAAGQIAPKDISIHEQDDDLVIVSPVQNDLWLTGSDVTISWMNPAGLSDVRIELSRNNGTDWETIVESATATTEKFDWVVTGPASNMCLIRIVGPGGFIFNRRFSTVRDRESSHLRR